MTPPARFAAALVLCLSALPAAADNAPFLGTDPVSVPAKGEIDLQQWFYWAHGHTGESYNAFESLTEIDYGLTDRLMLALTLDWDWDRTRPPGGPSTSNSLIGLQGEVVYVLAPIEQNPIGIALAIDPAFNPVSRGVAFRILLTKYLWGLENVLNINFENNWDKDPAGHWQESGAVVFNYGVGYALDPHWTVGLELSNQFTFDRLATSVNFHNAGTAVFLGPTVEYDCDLAVITLGFQTQLPVADGGNVANGYIADAERWRAGLRFLRVI